MFRAPDTACAPWVVAHTDDKQQGRLNIITHLLSQAPYEPQQKKKVTPPKRQKRGDYTDPNCRYGTSPHRSEPGVGCGCAASSASRRRCASSWSRTPSATRLARSSASMSEAGNPAVRASATGSSNSSVEASLASSSKQVARPGRHPHGHHAV